MGLKFNDIKPSQCESLFINTSTTEALTPENIRLLQSRGYKIRNVGKTGNLRKPQLRRSYR